jgi:hypothetical protein
MISSYHRTISPGNDDAIVDQICAACKVEPWELGIRSRLTHCCQARLTKGTYGRCTGCGHRQSRRGRSPVSTRYLPWLWPAEHLLRWRSRRLACKEAQ